MTAVRCSQYRLAISKYSESTNPEYWIEMADDAAYKAKSSGRNRVKYDMRMKQNETHYEENG